MRGKKQDIQIWTRGDPHKTVPALTFGLYLALHKGVDIGGWTITHIPTGLRILSADSQKQARTLIARLLKLDWARPDYKTALAPQVRLIRNMA